MRRVLAAALLLAACAGHKEDRVTPSQWRSDDGFEVQLPAGWEFEEDRDGSIPGIRLVRRVDVKPDGSAPEPASLIALSRYKGGRYYNSPEELVRAEAPKAKVEKATVNGLEALTFETSYTETFPPMHAEPTVHRTRSRYVLVKDAAGFWAFQYTAVEERFGANLPAFQKLLDSFKKT